jgi:hypothetical protein
LDPVVASIGDVEEFAFAVYRDAFGVLALPGIRARGAEAEIG